VSNLNNKQENGELNSNGIQSNSIMIRVKLIIKRKGFVSEALIFRRRLNLLSLLLGGVN
jgi:hypothetical protein